jgi:hypothetical protein
LEARIAHIERVYAPVELLDADILHGAAPLDAIEDHLLRLGRTVPTGFQEAPVRGAEKKASRREKENREWQWGSLNHTGDGVGCG